jgi:hypothetical protein
MIGKFIFETILGYIDCVGLSIPLFVFVFLGRKVSMPGKESVIAYFAIFFVGTLLASYLSYNEMYNNWVYDLIPLSLIIPLYFFFRQLPNSKIGKQISVLYLFLFLLYYIKTWQAAIDVPLNTEYYLYFAIFILINAAGYLLQELKLMREGFVFDRIEFWMVASLLFYACVCTLVWSFFTYLIDKGPEDFFHYAYIWSLCHNLTLFISCFSFSWVLYRKFR